MKIKIQPGTMTLRLSNTSSLSHLVECPSEIQATTVSEPALCDGKWHVTLYPVGEMYRYVVPANAVTIDGKQFHIVRVMETHATTKYVFATDAEDALDQAEDSCGDGTCEYVGTLGMETWTIERDGQDVSLYE